MSRALFICGIICSPGRQKKKEKVDLIEYYSVKVHMTHGMCYQGVAYICLKSWESTIIITLIIKHRGVNYQGMRMDVYLYFEYFFL